MKCVPIEADDISFWKPLPICGARLASTLSRGTSEVGDIGSILAAGMGFSSLFVGGIATSPSTFAND